MATERWIGGSGQGLTWGTAFNTADMNALPSGNAILSGVAGITNGSSLDVFADISFLAGATVTTAAPNFLGFYLYPLNQDGSTYGDGRFGSAAAGPPPGNYFIGSIGFAVGAGTTIAGTLTGIILPPGTFKFLLWNQAGVALAATNTCQYRTYNRQVL